MKEQDPAAGDLARLEATRARVRELVVGRQWLRRAFQQAFADFQILLDRYNAECRCLRMRELESSRALLERGEFGDGRAVHRVGRIRFEGLCPARLAEQISGKDPTTLQVRLRRESAKAALAAFDRHVLRQTAETSDEKCSRIVEEEDAAIAAKTHVPFAWTVFPPHPADWKEPPDPWSMDRDELERFNDEDYRVIALHRLGGLADVGSLRPLVPRPVTTGNIQIDTPAYAAWEARLPIPHGCSSKGQPPLSPLRFPPEEADQMLSTVVEWVTGLEDHGDEPPAVRLWRALGGLKGTLGDAAAFTELSALRIERARSQEAAFNAIAGGPFKTLTEGLAAAASVSHLLDRSVPQEPTDYLHHLADVLDEADRSCRNAITAISLGGAQKVDRCVSRDAAEASLAWGARIQRTQERLARLRWWLWLPSTVIEEDLRGVQDDCAWLEQAIAELQAAERVPEAKGEQAGGDKRSSQESAGDESSLLGEYKSQSGKAPQMRRTVRAAGESLEWAIVKNGAFEHLANEGGDALLPIHAWLKDQDCPCYPLSKDGKETLPSAETWLRYVRDYRRQTGKSAKPPKARVPDGKSVVRVEEI